MTNIIQVPKEFAAPAWDLETVPDALARADAGDDNDLLSIAALGNEAYVSIGALQFIGLRLAEADEPHAWLHHEPLNLGQKQAMFEAVHGGIERRLHSSEPVLPVKTVTLNIPGGQSPYVAVTTLGQRITNRVRQAMASELEVSPKVVKNAKLNPEEFDTKMVLGLDPGVVGPFVSPAAAARMRAWFYMSAPVPEDNPVEIALSSHDSLVMQRRGFEQLLHDYNQHFLQDHVDLRHLPEHPL